MDGLSKLVSFFSRLTDSSLRVLRRRRNQNSTLTKVPGAIEILESRQMLTPILTALESAPLDYVKDFDQTTGLHPRTVPVSSAITVTDTTDTLIDEAMVQITGNYQLSEDVLSFVNTPTITATWLPGLGRLALSGTDTLANYTAALQSVSYTNLALNASNSQRTLSFQAWNTYAQSSGIVSRSINVYSTNTSSILSGIESTPLDYIQHTIPPGTPANNVTPISSTITVGQGPDPYVTMIGSAVVQFTPGTYHPSEDRLVFSDTASITGSFNSSTGVLTLWGLDSFANYTAALRSVAYKNLSTSPNSSTRTVSFQISDADGSSPFLSRDIAITPVNASPVLAGMESSQLVYVDHPVSKTPPTSNAVVNVTNSIAVSDSDTPNMMRATVQISNNYASGQDVLSFSPTATIQGSWNATTGTLTLTGLDTQAAYAAALQSVTYTNTSLNPSTATRAISFRVTDQFGYISTVATRMLQYVHNNVAPVLTNLEPAALNYLARATEVYLTSTMQVVDADSPNLRSVKIQISNNYVPGEDQLNFTPINSPASQIGGAWDSITGTLTLFGVGTLLDYQQALQSVTYTNLRYTPTPTIRTVTFTPVDELGQCGDSVTRDIVIVAVSTPPVLTNIETTHLSYVDHAVGGGFPILQGVPVANVTDISSTISVNDSTSTYLQGATIKITGNYQRDEDLLTFTNTSTISSVWDASTGTLTLMGVDTVANYTLALRNVAYTNLAYDNLGRAPTQSMRTVSFQVMDDSNFSSLPITLDIQIIHNDNPPSVVNSDSSVLEYTEASTAQPIAPALTLADTDNTTLASATVTLSSYLPSADVLTFASNPTTMGNIAVYSNIRGVLTLTSSGATATLAQWQAALRSVGYMNSSNNPTVTPRTATFVVTDGPGLVSLSSAVRSIGIIPVNDPPTLSGIESTSLNWIENSVPPISTGNNITPITNTITVSDPDSSRFSGATIRIANNDHPGEDQLLFTNTAAITGTWDAATGTLTLTGSDTLAEYENALQSVSFTDTSDAPNTATRTISFTISDDQGAVSNAVTRTITITPADDPPVLTGLESQPILYVEDINSFASANITQNLLVSDPDSTNLQSATIQISSGYLSSEDQLLFTSTPAITGTWDSSTGTLTLTGTDTIANYQTAIRSIVYQNDSHDPSPAPRTVTIQVTDAEGLASTSVSRSISVMQTNNPPILAASNSTLTYVEGTGAQPVNPTIAVSDLDNTTLSKVTVTLSSFDVNADQLNFMADPATMGNITIASNLGGVLTLTSAGASATLAQWQAALQAVTFTSTTTSLMPEPRTATFVADDGQPENHASNSLSTTVNITVVYPPALSGSTSWTDTESSPATPINTTLSIANSAGSPLVSATIQITNFVAGEDQLSFTNDGLTMGNIAIVTNANGSLVLSSAGGTASLAQWEAALHAVSYLNTSLNPTTTSRNVTFQVDNGSPINMTSNLLSSTIAIEAINNPPTITNPDSTPAQYTEDDPGIRVFPNLSIADPDSTQLQGAVIQITGNYNANGSIDTLRFTNTARITGTFVISTGTLTLTGIDTVANYEAALRSVTFENHFDDTAPTRTLSLSVTDNTGLVSNLVTRNVEITTISNAPILSAIESTSQFYKYNDPYSPPPVISSTIQVRDYDSGMMNGAVVTIAGNYDANLERLGFDITGTSLKGSWNASTGQLFIYGQDTVANYTKALRTVAYLNLGSQSTLTRTISFQIADDTSIVSNVVSRDLSFVDTNVAPTLASNSPSALNFVEGSPATPIAPSLTISDPDSPLMQSATVKISTNYVLNEDRLVYTSVGRIRGFFQSTSATLYLSGADTVANYQAALRSVQYLNTSSSPSTATRTISFIVSDGLATSSVVSRNITVQAINDPPTVRTNEQSDLTYSATDGAVAIVPELTVTDPDNATLACATVRIVSNYQRNSDFLEFVNPVPGSNITGNFDATTGVLKLTGTDSVTNYRLALAAVTYRFVGSPETMSKMIFLNASDGITSSQSVSRRINVVSA